MADLSIQLTKLKTFVHMPSGKTFVAGETYTLPKREAEDFLGMSDDGIPRFKLALKKGPSPASFEEEAPVRRKRKSRITEETRERIRKERSMASSKKIEPPEDSDPGTEDTGSDTE